MTDNHNSISVIIPVYNRCILIERAIKSVVGQTISPDEIIVIDDGSTDGTDEIIKNRYPDIILLKQKNRGVSCARNNGIKNAKGQFIVRVDADDYVHWDYIKILSMHLQLNHSIDAVACDYLLVDNNQNILSQKNCFEESIGCGIMFRLNQLISIGLYDENFLAREDEDLLIRFKKKYNISRVQLPLYRYRKHQENLTNDKNKMKEYSEKISEWICFK